MASGINPKVAMGVSMCNDQYYAVWYTNMMPFVVGRTHDWTTVN